MADRDLSGRTLGEYILREQIGEGGYGAVYRGEQPLLERDVVVKVLHAQRSDNDSRERFLREARLAAQLRHPYAAQIYASGAEDRGSLLWIAMERVEGISLDAWLHRHGPMPFEQFVPFFEGVCEVVDAAHERGIVHRDLKPSNIMVVECRDRLLPKLLDFGIAKDNRRLTVASCADENRDADRDDVKTERLQVRPRRASRTVACYDADSRHQLTPPGACLGSRAYMAPEQWIGADVVGPEADIYALGVVAYQTLTGRLPFVADRTDEYFELHRRAPVPRLGDSFPPDLDPAIRCALDKYPRARHSSALELAKDLRRVLRAGVREQLRASAQQWSDQAWAPGLLWGADVLEDALRSAPRETLSQLECSFVAESQRRIRRTRWVRRSLAALAAAVAIGGFLYDAAMQTRQATLQTQLAQEQTRSAQEVAAATVTQAELEQGRAALLHCEPDAWLGLGRAYQRGDRSPSTAFMLARALQPRLAERARFTSTIVALSSDGKLVAAIGAKGDVAHVWDAITGALVAEIRNDGPESSGLAFSPDGRWLATTGGSDVLMLRSQTLRVLANTDLSRAIGGDSGARCPAVVDSGDVACPTTFAAVTTANCR